MKNNNDWVKKFNSSQNTKAWFETIFCYLLLFIFNPINPIASMSDVFGKNIVTQKYYVHIYTGLIIAAIYFTYLHIKKLITGEDVWKNVKFTRFINDESELNEGKYVKKIKKILYPILIILVCVIFIPIILLFLIIIFNK